VWTARCFLLLLHSQHSTSSRRDSSFMSDQLQKHAAGGSELLGCGNGGPRAMHIPWNMTALVT